MIKIYFPFRFVAVLQPSSDYQLPCNDIKGYDNLLVNKKDVFNAETGVFHSPCDGMFKFFIDAHSNVFQHSDESHDYYYYANLDVLVNGEIIKTLDIVTSTVYGSPMIEGSIFLDLKYGQEVKLSNRDTDHYGIKCLVIAGPSYPLIFSGYQII